MKEIILSGIIGLDVFAEDIRREFEEAEGDAILLKINSPGGSWYQALEIVDILKDYPSDVTTKIIGLAASAASYIFSFGDTRTVTPESVQMIHNPAMGTYEDYRGHFKTSEILDRLAGQAAEGYSKSSGKKITEVREEMDRESWLFGSEIVDNGYADEIDGAEDTEPMDRETAIIDARGSFAAVSLKMGKDELGKVAACLGTIESAESKTDPDNDYKDELEAIKAADPYNTKLSEVIDRAISGGKSPEDIKGEIFAAVRNGYTITETDKQAAKLAGMSIEEYTKFSNINIKGV